MRCADAPSPGSWQNSFVAFEGSCQGSQSGECCRIRSWKKPRHGQGFRIVKGERGAVLSNIFSCGVCYEPYS